VVEAKRGKPPLIFFIYLLLLFLKCLDKYSTKRYKEREELGTVWRGKLWCCAVREREHGKGKHRSRGSAGAEKPLAGRMAGAPRGVGIETGFGRF